MRTNIKVIVDDAHVAALKNARMGDGSLFADESRGFGLAVAKAVVDAGSKALCDYCRNGVPAHDIRPYGVEGQVVPFLHDIEGEPRPCFAGHLRALAEGSEGR